MLRFDLLPNTWQDIVGKVQKKVSVQFLGVDLKARITEKILKEK